MPYWEYELSGDRLCLGVRPKGGLFRPCDTHAIRYSAATGALREFFGEVGLHAAGYFLRRDGHNIVDYLTYGPRNDAAGVSVLPLTVQFVSRALGRVVVKSGRALPQSFDLSMGALKSQGLGRCTFRLLGAAPMDPVRGALLTRLPSHRAEEFGIPAEWVIGPLYGYLFEPTSPEQGDYVLSLFEGSQVRGPRCLVQEEEL